jgi:hypothetical protein
MPFGFETACGEMIRRRDWGCVRLARRELQCYVCQTIQSLCASLRFSVRIYRLLRSTVYGRSESFEALFVIVCY